MKKFSKQNLKKKVFTLTIVSSLFFISIISFTAYHFYVVDELKVTNSSKERIKIDDLTLDKTALLAELNEKLSEYDSLIIENNELKSFLEIERDLVKDLIVKVELMQKEVKVNTKTRKDFYNLRDEIKGITTKKVDLADVTEKANKKLQDDNTLLTSETSKIKEISETKVNENKFPLEQPSNNLAEANDVQSILDSKKQPIIKEKKETPVLVKTEDKNLDFNKLQIEKFKIIPLESKRGKNISTIKASRVTFLQAQFVIKKNEKAYKGNRLFYIQIFNADNRIIGRNTTVSLGNKKLNYSYSLNVDYLNEDQIVKENISLTNSNFIYEQLEKGTYFVNIFDEMGYLLMSQNFNLE